MRVKGVSHTVLEIEVGSCGGVTFPSGDPETSVIVLLLFLRNFWLRRV